MGSALEAITFLLIGLVLLGADVSTIRHRPRAAQALVDWWIEESRTPAGRKRLGFGPWSNKKFRDPIHREAAARITSFNLIVILTMGSLVCMTLGILMVVRR